MSLLKDKLAQKFPEKRDFFRKLVKEKGDVKLSDVMIGRAHV